VFFYSLRYFFNENLTKIVQSKAKQDLKAYKQLVRHSVTLKMVSKKMQFGTLFHWVSY